MADDRRRQELIRRLAAAKANAARIDRAYTGGTGPLVPPMGWGDIWADVWRSDLSSARSGLESTLGIGDISDLKYSLAQLISSKGPLDYSKDLEKAQQYATPLPTSEDVGRVTDYAVSKLPQSVSGPIQNVTRHEPTTPFGQGIGIVTELGSSVLDPALLVTKGPSVARKMIYRTMRRR